MLIHDRIYGAINITEEVVVELINSNPLQRLKKISQDGAPHFIQPIRNVTRFEHSIGVWYLSFLYKRPIEEQIASLLHDIPHTAFSHVIDFVMADEKHEFHEKFTNQIILNSEIPGILKKHSIDINKILNKENYDLLENDLPDLSVDRWDYFMRDGFMFGLLPIETINLFLDSVRVSENYFYFPDYRVAGLFAVMFMNCSRLIWLDPTSHGSFFLISQALKIGLENNLITEKDFFSHDEELISKLRQCGNQKINNLLDRLTPEKNFKYSPKENAEFYGANKPRYVNPIVEINGERKRLSEVVPNMVEYFNEFAQNYKYLGVTQLD